MKQLDFTQYAAQELSISEEESQKLLSEFSFHISNELNKTNKYDIINNEKIPLTNLMDDKSSLL